MADSDKDILITPQTGAATDPSIVFSSGATSGDDVTLFVTDDGTITTLSIEGSAGQLFSVSNDLTGVIFSVNDVSGIPSLEVNADGTVSMVEFDGDVGIGTSSPTHKVHITGPTTANTATGIFVDSTGDAYLDLRADNTVGGLETNNPYVRFRQDQDAIETVIGHNNTGDDANGNTFTGAAANAFTIHNRHASGTISLGVNGNTGLTIDDNDRVYIGQDRTGYFTAVTGQYGSVQVDGAEGSGGTWSGYSIGARSIFMDVGGTATTNRFGLYDDLNNQWALQYNTAALGNDELSLYYGGSVKLTTASGGVTVTGTMAATSVTGDGSGLTSLTAANISAGSLATGVNSYFTASTAASEFKVPFMNYTGTASTNAGLLHDDQSTFTYNPSTNTLSAGAFSGSGASVTNVDAITLNGASESDAAGNSTIVKRTASGYIYCNFLNSTSGATATAPSHIWVETGNDSFIRQQTIANFRTNVVSGATIAGDVTGTIGATVVGNDSHTHAFNNLTSKGSGTGNYLTTGQMQAAAGFHGSYDDAASGAWGGPIWGMDDGFTGATGGASSLPTSCYGIRWNRVSSTQANTNIGEGLYVYTAGTLEGGIGTSGTYSVGAITTSSTFRTSGTTITLAAGTSASVLTGSVSGTASLYHAGGLEFRTQQHEGGGITSGAEVYDHGGVLRDVGFNTLDTKKTNVSDTLEATDCGGAYIKTVSTAYTISLPSATTTAGQDFPVDGVVTVFNAFTSGNYTINASVYSRTLYWLDGSTRTGGASTNRTVGPGGIATIWRQSSTVYYIWGSGIS